MKLSFFLLVIPLLYVSAGTYSQNTQFTINGNNLKIENVLYEIESQSDYTFLYRTSIFKDHLIPELEINNAGIDEVLDQVLVQQGFKYEIIDKTIVISQSAAKPEIKRQQTIVTGKVLDSETGSPLPGVNIRIESTSQGSITDGEGFFTIEIPGNEARLVFSFIGYSSQTISVSGNQHIEVALVPELKEIDGVVVIGYGSQKKSTLTGSVASISQNELLKMPVADITNSLIGRIPGIISKQSAGDPGMDGSTIYIRGIATFSGTTTPSFIIDGIERTERDFSQLDPNEIETVSILKDASAAGVFGLRGANGVILVTTRRGKSGTFSANYSVNYGLQSPAMLPKFLDSYNYAVLFNEARENERKAPIYTDEALLKYKDGTDPDRYPNTDWYSVVLRKNAPQIKHNLSLNGGNEKAKYFVSLGVLDQDGLYKSLNYKRYNIRSNVDLEITKTTHFSIDLSGRYENTNAPSTNSRNIFYQLMRNPPIKPARFSNGLLAFPTPYPNPLALIQPNAGYSKSQNNALLSRFELSQDIPWVKGLSLKGIMAFDKSILYSKVWNDNITLYTVNKDSTFSPTTYNSPSLQENYYQLQNLELQAHVSYQNSFGNNNISGLFLYLQSQSYNKGTGGGRTNYVSSAFDVLNAGPSENQTLYGYENNYGRISFIGRLNYNYKLKYLLEGSFRYDASENFATDHRWGFFPSISAGWVLSEESFIADNIPLINYLKIRYSYGVLGNDNIPGNRFAYYSKYELYSPSGQITGPWNMGDYAFGGQYVTGLMPGPIANELVTWESAKKTNLGLESRWFNSMFTINLDLFKERREGILTQRSLSVPTSFGAKLPAENIGIVENKGIELFAEHSYKIGTRFTYFINGNLTFASNKIINIDEASGVPDYLKQTGRPIGSYYGLSAIGIFQTSDEITASPKSAYNLGPGDLKYEDVNHDTIINDDDRTYLGGSNIPEMVYGFSGGFNYRGFDLVFIFQGAARVVQKLEGEAVWAFYNGGKVMEEWLDRWTPDNPGAKYPRVMITAPNNQLSSSFWLRDASYLRLKNLEIGYTFPSNLGHRMGISKIRIYSNGVNLLTYSPLKNVDPENIDLKGWYYPQQKLVNFGINVEF